MEVWKDIEGHEDYKVSSQGRVKSMKFGKEKILKVGNTNGYPTTNLSKKGVLTFYYIHQLVAVAFLDHNINGHTLVVDHMNNIRHDNRVENLRVITPRKNVYTHHKGTSKYKGVSWNKWAKKWQVNIYFNGKINYLGCYDDEVYAKGVYNKFCDKNKLI